MQDSLYDLAPVARILTMGVLLASGPLVWVWTRHRGGSLARRLRALTLLTLFLTFDLVLFGAFTRLTDSGLGCPDWPGCYGSASPLGAHADISAAQSAMPTGPVTHGKAWVEMVHRYLATGVGALILVLAVLSWIAWRRSRAQGQARVAIHPGWPTFTLVWVCLQGAFGALTVTMKLFPAIVTMHLAGGLVLLALLVMQAVRFSQAAGQAPVRIGSGLRAFVGLGFAAVVVQVLLGGWVSTNYAVLACREFPSCQGGFWPPMDFANGFEFWRPLGLTAGGEGLPFAALTAIHYVHRLWAYVVLVLLALVAAALWRGPLARQARWIAGLAAWQLATGLSNVVLDWPLVAAISHTGGAAALVAVFTWTLAESRGERVAVAGPAPRSAAQRRAGVTP